MPPHPDVSRRNFAKGTVVRVAIGAAKRAIAAREVTPQAAFHGESADHDLGISRARIGGLLTAFPGIGKPTAKDICTRAGIDPESRLSDHGWATREQILQLVLLAQETYSTTSTTPDESWKDAPDAAG